MTSTHLDPRMTELDMPVGESTAAPNTSKSPSADSSFSDAYKEQAAGLEDRKDVNLDQDSDVSDDYAMAVDSDGEEHADSQDISQAKFESDAKSLPTTISNLVAPSPLSYDATTTCETQAGQATQTIPTNPTPTHSIGNVSADDGRSDPTVTVAQTTTEETKPAIHTYEDVTNGGIDIQQLLDNITANAEKNESTSTVNTPSSPSSKTPFSKGSSGLPTHASLPPRPNNLPSITQMRPPTTIVAAGAPGTSTDPRGLLPPPPSVSFRPPPIIAGNPVNPASYPASYTQINRSARPRQPGTSIGSQDEVDDTDAKWGPEVQRIYDEFLVKEREYVEHGSWDQFPPGSRLFIGNLASEAVTKRDLFHIFHKYGRIAQISIKQAYGFIQFYNSESCRAAKEHEQTQEVRGKRMALEISKPQKNTQRPPGIKRRSQSPDFTNYARGGASDRGSRPGGRSALVDRYDGRAAPTYRSDEYGRPIRVRDDYRPLRSPTPPRGNFRGRDEYMPRGRDSYDSRERQRSRSPYGYRDNGGYRERSLSPQRREANEDSDLQIPRRNPADVPDVQILLLEQLAREFVSWVENEMGGRGIKVEVMFLNPRLPLQAIIRRQILEGVHAVSKLDMRSQLSGKIPLQVFDRQGGANNVRFDEYQDLEPRIAAELVLRAKKTQPPPQVQNPQYAQPQFPVGQSFQPQVTPPPAANLASLVGQLDNATLQKLLSGYQLPQQQQNAPAVAANNAIDFAGLLGGLTPHQPQSQQGYQQSQQQPQPGLDPYANLASNPALASLLRNTGPPQPAQTQPQQSDQQVQNIMAQLARYRQ